MENDSGLSPVRGSDHSQQQPISPLAIADQSATDKRGLRPSGGDALQALLAFSAMHQQVRRRRALALQHAGFESTFRETEFGAQEQFVLDEVLQLVAERAIAITGADGLAIALAENDEIVLRASAGTVKPDVGARIQRDSAFSGACFRTAKIIRCDDTETDDRVNLSTCRRLGARSMVAVPLCGRRRVIGLLEAFSIEPFGFNDSDLSSLELLAELIVAALKPEDEDRFAEAAQVAERELGQVDAAPDLPSSVTPRQVGETAEPPEVTSETETAPVATPSDRSVNHPGIALVLLLVALAMLLGTGLWWKLKRTQFQSTASRVTTPAALSHASANTPVVRTPMQGALSSQSAQSAQTSSVPTSARGSNAAGNSSADNDLADEMQPPASTNSENAAPESAKPTRITGVRHWSSAESSTVVLDLEDQVQYEAHRLANPERIYFDLHDTSLAPDLEGRSIDIGDELLARVRLAQPVPGLTRLVLETKGNSSYSVSLEPNPYRLVVQVTKIGAAPKAQINLFPGAEGAEREKQAIVVPPPTKQDLKLRALVPKLRIVVDPGHGGWDLGTVGRRGLLEKDLVLEIAQRLGKLLETRLGADVILTRNDDTYIPLDERAGMANQAQADLFISIHANYSDLPSARGVETYYTNMFSSPNAKYLETRDGSTNKSANSPALTATELYEKIEQSQRLAISVQRTLYGALAAENPGLRDRGVREASYVVLTETAMPGILAEVSFVSSPTDEQKLRSDKYREQIAEALYRGIARYAANSRAVKIASAGK
jgi:N-acetylmuramoyl-L-alanine amidase/putative methionine-R-sulfoxide reductase with GAF domain